MRRTTLFVLLLAVFAAPAAASAKPKKKADPQITVMSRNLYLGADLGPAIAATDICGAIDAGGKILNDVDASNFPERAKLLAAEIAKAKPDLLGLQEAALWRYEADADFTATPATTVRYDFLQELQDALKAAGAPYDVAVVQDEFDQELPADRDGSDATQDATFPQCGTDEDGRLTMRDAILVRKGSAVKVSGKQMGHYKDLYTPKLGGVVPVPVTRGWVSVEGKVAKTKTTKAASLHFVDTHLESFGDPAIRTEQAKELLAGPLKTSKQLIMVCDCNSGSKADHIDTPFTTAGDGGAYAALVGGGLTSLGTRQTCCYPDVFQPVIGSYRFDHTVDHVFVKPKIKQLKAYVTGGDPSVTGAGGVVASDHGGLVSRLRL